MKDVTNILDQVAEALEERGAADLASTVDVEATLSSFERTSKVLIA
jgi:hypothetical protein